MRSKLKSRNARSADAAGSVMPTDPLLSTASSTASTKVPTCSERAVPPTARTSLGKSLGSRMPARRARVLDAGEVGFEAGPVRVGGFGAGAVACTDGPGGARREQRVECCFPFVSSDDPPADERVGALVGAADHRFQRSRLGAGGAIVSLKGTHAPMQSR